MFYRAREMSMMQSAGGCSEVGFSGGGASAQRDVLGAAGSIGPVNTPRSSPAKLNIDLLRASEMLVLLSLIRFQISYI
jgi:hypothetical protein